MLARVDDSRMLLFRGPGPARLIDHVSGEVTPLDTVGSDGSVSSDGRYVVSQPEEPGPVRIVDLERPTDPGRVIAFDGTLGTAAFTPDGATLALADACRGHHRGRRGDADSPARPCAATSGWSWDSRSARMDRRCGPPGATAT